MYAKISILNSVYLKKQIASFLGLEAPDEHDLGCGRGLLRGKVENQRFLGVLSRSALKPRLIEEKESSTNGPDATSNNEEIDTNVLGIGTFL